jgi:hypothetical protein
MTNSNGTAFYSCVYLPFFYSKRSQLHTTYYNFGKRTLRN